MSEEFVKKNKKVLLKFIEAMDLGNITDLKVVGGELYCEHPMTDCDKVVWFNAREEGGGFCQLFGIK